MKYFAGFLIEGEAAEWHSRLASEVARAIGSESLPDHIQPHVTVYYFGELNDTSDIMPILEKWAEQQQAAAFTLGGYGHFDTHTVFVKAETDDSTKQSIEDLRSKLKAVPNIADDHNTPWHPHASLARKLTLAQSEQALDYLSALPSPEFSLMFDRLILFRFENGTYTVDRAFGLSQT